MTIADPALRASQLKEAADLHLARRNDPVAAIPLLEEAVALVPEDVTARLTLASARRVTGDIEGAATTLNELITMYGTRRPKERALVHFELSRVAVARNDRAGALNELNLASRIDPTHPHILHAQARLAFEEGELDRATRTYRSLLLILRKPKGETSDGGGLSRAEVLFELSEIARRMDEPDRAAEHLTSAFEAARDQEGDRERLLALLRERGRYDVLATALEDELKGALTPRPERASWMSLRACTKSISDGWPTRSKHALHAHGTRGLDRSGESSPRDRSTPRPSFALRGDVGSDRCER